jgi:hypothetical protein
MYKVNYKYFLIKNVIYARNEEKGGTWIAKLKKTRIF